MKRFLTIATLALSLVSSAACADTRGDYISHPEAYGTLTMNKGLVGGRVVSFDIPISASLLAPPSAGVPISGGRVLASSIAYARPVSSVTTPLGMAYSPYARQ